MTIQTNPNVNERGETFEQYQERVEARMTERAWPTPQAAPVIEQTTTAQTPQQVILANSSDPIVEALRARLLQLEGIAVKHLLENQSNRQQVRTLVAERERNVRKFEKAKIYRQELKRIHARHRLVILELDALKRRYDNLVRLSVMNEAAERDLGYQSGYQTGHFDGYNEARADVRAEQNFIDTVGQPAQFTDEAVDEYFNTPSNN